ncbi:FAD-binding domain protein [Rhizoctonia solani]|uniref:FAD-binding domain protein n=1 Tax=Rhizoctonia solani TaxID=456999 RepID=A0A8H8SXZ1_9AGAM|nr:FAD-binding domain protein [Rhizoctonia solani]QRW20803.1 FAD-binding domain protein [Rhizoctonia solani]
MSLTTVDVLIVGAGPAGLMCAYSLSQAGLHVRIIDKKTERLQKGQGDVLQTRGLEIIDSLGLSSQILQEAQRCVHTATYASSPASNGEISLVSRKSVVQGVDSNMVFMGLYAQSSVEGILRQVLASGRKHIPSATFVPESQPLSPSRKVEVEQGVFPVEMKVTDDGDGYPVTACLQHPDGKKETVKAKYLLGCDGAHSWVRTQLGIEMVGETSDQVWGVVDAYIDTDFPDVRALTVFDNNGRHAVLIPRENDMVRFTIQVSESDVSVNSETGRIDRTKIGVERILQLVKGLMKPYRVDFKRVDWSGVYVIGQRLASRYQDQSKRIFILGDACHTHSPHAGQGMNAAISDAHNLSWKLVHVLKGWGAPELLHTYESERRDFAVKLIELHERIAEVMSGKVKGTSSDLMIKSVKFVWPFSTLDLCNSDNMYKIIVLTGDAKDTTRREKLEEVGKTLKQWRLQRPNMFQVYTIMATKKENGNYTDVPDTLRPYWDTVFLDDISYAEHEGGGKAYQSFGVGPEGCLVLVRPDGHVAALASLEESQILQALCSVKIPLGFYSNKDSQFKAPSIKTAQFHAPHMVMGISPPLMSTEVAPLLPTLSEQPKQSAWLRIKKFTNEAKTLVKSAIPVLGAQILEYSLILVSAVSLGHVSTEALAASSLSSITATVTGLSVVHGFASALDSLLPQAWTSDHPENVGLWAQRMVIVMLINTLPITAIWLNAENILLRLGQEEKIAHLAGLYLGWFTLTLPGLIIGVVTRRYLQAQGIMHAQTIVMVFIAPANLFLNWLLVWGPPAFRLGFIGAPIASSISFTLSAAIYVGYACVFVPKKAWHPIGRQSFRGLGTLYSLGLSGTGQIATEWWSWEFLGLMSSRFGATSLAAQSVLLVSASVAFQTPYSLGVSVAVRVGNLLGSGDSRKAKVAAETGIGLSIITALTMRYTPFLSLFIVDGVTAVTDGVLRATGRLGLGAMVNITAYYCIGIPLGLYLAFWKGLELQGLWIRITAAIFYAASASVYAVSRTSWQKEVENASQRLKRGQRDQISEP